VIPREGVESPLMELETSISMRACDPERGSWKKNDVVLMVNPM
jgi:hypothetical protein